MKSKDKILTILALMLVVVSIMLLVNVSAESYLFEQFKESSLQFTCYDINNSLCSPTTTCQITINYPNNTNMVNNQSMTYNNIQFLYSLSTAQTTTLGTYYAFVSCQGSNNAFTTFSYKVTPNGQMATSGSAIFYIGLLIALIFFFAIGIWIFMTTDNLLAKVGSLGISYLLLVAITFIGWNMADDFTTSLFLIDILRILFYILIIGALPLFIGAFAWWIIMVFKIKEIKRMMEKGISYDEARKRTGRKFR